jgi:hypothetical protein
VYIAIKRSDDGPLQSLNRGWWRSRPRRQPGRVLHLKPLAQRVMRLLQIGSPDSSTTIHEGSTGMCLINAPAPVGARRAAGLGGTEGASQARRHAARTMRLAILAALLSITLGARVQPQQAMIIISGTGLYSCGRWTDDRRNSTLTAYGEGQWILGYIVGATALSLPV